MAETAALRFPLQDVLSQICEPGGRGPAELLKMSPMVSSPMPDRLGTSALRAASLCREPFEWWLTALAMHSPQDEPAFGAFAPLTCGDLGLSCISISQPEVLYGREMNHPIRHALQLYNARREAEVEAREGSGTSAASSSMRSDTETPPAPGTASDSKLMQAAFNEEELALFAVWQAG